MVNRVFNGEEMTFFFFKKEEMNDNELGVLLKSGDEDRREFFRLIDMALL